jgi:peptidoglycan/LPS O-acetylase OafA/YrhL
MSRSFSLYLDTARVAAALLVFLSHFSIRRISGGWLWQLQERGHDAVIVFFVLSGLVIAYAVAEKERTLRRYAVNRLSRLYSVVLPAIALTIAADAIGRAAAPDFYGPTQGFSYAAPVEAIVRAALFMTQAQLWRGEIVLFSNIPFWSLAYEFWFYVLFGAATFLTGPPRIAAIVLAAILTGPAVLALAPIWLLGVAAWRWSGRRGADRPLGILLVVLSSAAILAILVLGHGERWAAADPHRLLLHPLRDLIHDGALGVAVAAHFAGIRLSGFRFSALAALGRPIRWAAGMTFSLYLFHRPLLQMFSAVGPGEPGEAFHNLFVAAATLATCAALAEVTERRKDVLRRLLDRLLAGRRVAPATRS